MKEPSSIQIGLKIPKDAEGILAYVHEVLELLKAQVILDEDKIRKIKLILVELVTNSIKHSEDENASIEFTFSHPTLTIQKVDKGLQIEFAGDSEQIPFVELDRTIKVHLSESQPHHIKILDPYRFRFIDNYKEGITIDFLPEHFGLYIITLASDSFIYQHDPDLLENRFIVHLNL